jgi:hypothetical protein
MCFNLIKLNVVINQQLLQSLDEDFENQDPFLFLTNGIIPKSETHSRYLRIIQNFVLGNGPHLKREPSKTQSPSEKNSISSAVLSL